MSGFPVLWIHRIKSAGLFLIIYIFLSITAQSVHAKGAVCLSDSTEIQVKENLTAQIKVHRYYEITSETGIRFAQVIIPVNDFIEVRDINGFTELPNGQLVKLSKKDISTSSAPGFKGLGGIEAMSIALRTPTVGSRIYYEYVLDIKSLLYLPRITRRTDCLTKRLVVNLKWDKGVNLHYDTDGVEITSGNRSARFTANDLVEVPDEPELCPDKFHISISADIFSYDKNQYYSRNWPEVGRFFALLAIQPPDVEAELKALADRLCANCQNREDTLLAFFDFLADSVSYVALQMGKGDFTPHTCLEVLSRRFGDCKDQSVLLSSLCRAAGFDAYPALIFTGNYPSVSNLHPWPAWFDHVITVVRSPKGDQLLDPSDPLGSPTVIPPRLRGKTYLICDGHSELKTVSSGPDPAFGITWNLHILRRQEQALAAELSLKYFEDAAALYKSSWNGKEPERALIAINEQLKNWHLSGLELNDARSDYDTLSVSGQFKIDLSAVADSHNLSIASPLGSYLLDNLFPDARKNDFCRTSSLRLEETVAIDLASSGIVVGPEYSDSWRRQGISFVDEMTINGETATYHRLFNVSAETINVTDYNAFRDFLLSRRDQQYVRLQK